MIKIENCEVLGWDHAIRGMRNPMNSWEKSDSGKCYGECLDCDKGAQCTYIYTKNFGTFGLGEADYTLAMKLANAGPVHGKFRRMITVYVDITAPLYFWKEFDTYKVGTVANSCSTMHKIHARPLTIDDFSTDHLLPASIEVVEAVIRAINECRDLYSGFDGFKYKYGEAEKKEYWYNMIQLLPSSYNQKRTVQLNYEVLANMYQYRKAHKLDEWREFCKWIEELPYSEIITGYGGTSDE